MALQAAVDNLPALPADAAPVHSTPAFQPLFSE